MIKTMLTSPQDSTSLEIKTLAQSFNFHGVLVSARCFEIRKPRPHFEILLQGRSERAVVDVSLKDEHRLPEILERAADGFAASLKIRMLRSFSDDLYQNVT